MTDLSQSFNKLKDILYENIQGCLCEILPENKYKWNGNIGTRDEIEKAIKESGKNIENSLKNKST